PYDRRDELVDIAGRVANISAKHEGGDPEVEQKREHASDILDYFRSKEEVLASGQMGCWSATISTSTTRSTTPPARSPSTA
ncbi:MAG: hypothetical protein HW378_3794, partial [Anaerolineales bacterium]|nr:hypothetical protein [Anaerolineales bacterium]